MNVAPLGGEEPALAALAARWPFRPYRWSVRSAPALDALAAHRLGELVRRPANRAWAASRGGDVVGVSVLQPLEWDSRILGTPAGRFEIVAAGDYAERATATRALLGPTLERARADGIRHLSVRIDAEDDAVIQTLEAAGFLNVDVLMTFGLELTSAPEPAAPADGVQLRPATAEDREAIGALAARTFLHSRFHSDPAVAPAIAAEVHREWAANCCTRQAADETIVAVDGGGIAGFIACRIAADTVTHLKRPTGTIVLVATDHGNRRRGLGALLVAAANAWFRHAGAAAVEVGTQLRNVPAARLYERCGFRLVSGALSFRTLMES